MEQIRKSWKSKPLRWITAALLMVLATVLIATVAYADIPGRKTPLGTSVPLPGTQQQELANITFPAPYNVFEFPQTCAECHGGNIVQSRAHYGVWSGSVMGSTARNPVFRADAVVVNEKVKAAGLGDGAANVCWRCHVQNAFLSGRGDPELGGDAKGGDFIQQITLSTDNEGIQCEFCHKLAGAVFMNRIAGTPSNDPAFKMLYGIKDWPHIGDRFPIKGDIRSGPLGAGEAYTEATSGPPAGGVIGMATYQINDGMTYGGKYSGTVKIHFSDVPILGFYTGQTYGVQPGTTIPVLNPDGSYPIQYEEIIGPPAAGAQWQAMSPEHTTYCNNGTTDCAKVPLGETPTDFLRSPEFCGVCHDRTLSPVNLGMPRAKEYTEWKLSVYGEKGGVKGPKYRTCQSCHMPTLKHEYSDDAPFTLNADPAIVGWFPYAKDRTPMGGTAVHKFQGANYNLSQQMKVLYPEVDMELIGAPTGRDVRMFPGLLSHRNLAYDRNIQDSEIFMRDAASVQITQAPVCVAGICEVKVRVTNNGPHRFPSGLPDGRRAWISLVVKDSLGAPVYLSGYYDPNEAALYNDASKTYDPAYFAKTGTRFRYAQSPVIDTATPGSKNAVMVYERRTGHQRSPGDYVMTYDLSNIYIMFDNRIPYEGFVYSEFDENGLKLRKFNETTFVPSEDATRYPDGQRFDEVTYRFPAGAGTQPFSARADLIAQTHTRDFLDFLDAETRTLPTLCATCSKGPRPEGPPNILEPNYPATPTYLSDQVVKYWNATQPTDITNITQIRNLNNLPLEDTWAGVAYASWLLSGKSKPILVGSADTKVAAPPGAPQNVGATARIDPATGLTDPFSLTVNWTPPIAGAQGYVVWVRYGKDPGTVPISPTADWDKLSIVYAPATSFLHDGLNVAKTYGYKVQAFNEAGIGPDSIITTGTTPVDLPFFPMNLKVLGVTDTTATLAWYDQADNEVGFIIERQDVPLDTTTPWPNFVEVARIPSQTIGALFGGNQWTNTGLLPGRTYNYRVAAYNASGMSTYNDNGPVAATTLGKPPAPTGLAATVFSSARVDLSWTDNSGSELGFRIERAGNAQFTAPVVSFLVGPNVTSYSDTTVTGGLTYYYRVFAYNASGDSPPSIPASVTTPTGTPPPAPAGLAATATSQTSARVTWRNVQGETGFVLERATDPNFAAITRIPATGTLPANVLAYTDNTVAAMNTYWYRVRAVNAAGSSPPSNVAYAITPGGVPQAPENLAVGLVGKTFVQLSWTDKSINEQGFYVERSDNNGTTWKRVGTTTEPNVGAVASFQDNSVKAGTQYLYRVQAYNATGVSAYTNFVSATTLSR